MFLGPQGYTSREVLISNSELTSRHCDGKQLESKIT